MTPRPIISAGKYEFPHWTDRRIHHMLMQCLATPKVIESSCDILEYFINNWPHQRLLYEQVAHHGTESSELPQSVVPFGLGLTRDRTRVSSACPLLLPFLHLSNWARISCSRRVRSGQVSMRTHSAGHMDIAHDFSLAHCGSSSL